VSLLALCVSVSYNTANILTGILDNLLQRVRRLLEVKIEVSQYVLCRIGQAAIDNLITSCSSCPLIIMPDVGSDCNYMTHLSQHT